jgi:hypothetical protein
MCCLQYVTRGACNIKQTATQLQVPYMERRGEPIGGRLYFATYKYCLTLPQLKEKKGIYDAKVRELLLLSKQGTPPNPNPPPTFLAGAELACVPGGRNPP